MTIIEIIVITLVLILAVNAFAWVMIWRAVKKLEDVFGDEIVARECVKDIKFLDEVEK